MANGQLKLLFCHLGLENPLFAGAGLHRKREEVRKTKGILLEDKIAKLLQTVLI